MWEALLQIFSITSLSAVITASSPLIFASLGETLNERGGVINLSVEGSMMLGAMTAFIVTKVTGNIYLGMLAAMLVGMAMALIVAFGSITLHRDQVAIGFILAILGQELSSFLGAPWVRQPIQGVQPFKIPFLGDIPIIGPLLFDHDILTYASLLLILGMWWLFYRTQPGLKLRGVGDKPAAAFARGVNVNFMRYVYTLAGGALIGLGGAAFSLWVQLGWSHNHTAGFGWIALAIVIFGGWHPLRVALGCYLFGLLRASATELQPIFPNLPVQVFPLLPFPLMILTLVFFNSQGLKRLLSYLPIGLSRNIQSFLASRAPEGLGQVFVQD
ncbi:MAG TPA: ABC transporter permease [Anaerolineales bacterium]|nr:ABC transporter permease [Anaerolineales bacterium]